MIERLRGRRRPDKLCITRALNQFLAQGNVVEVVWLSERIEVTRQDDIARAARSVELRLR
jgi:hypothetical protein